MVVAPVGVSMARKVTAGHQSLRQSEHGSTDYTPTHDVVAVSPEGEDLWVTQSYYERNPEDPQVCFTDDYGGISQRMIDGQMVDHFELREV